jgi:hypothetical protein
MTWKDIKDVKPEPMKEVLVLIDGHRTPSWSNNYALVAYMDNMGDFWEERHNVMIPLCGVIKWLEIPDFE